MLGRLTEQHARTGRKTEQRVAHRHGQQRQQDRQPQPALQRHWRLAVGPLRAMLLELVVHGFKADAEKFGGTGLVLFGVVEGFEDQCLLAVVDGYANSDENRFGVARGNRSWIIDRRGEVRGSDQAFASQNHRAFEHIAQLTDIARLTAALQREHGRLVDTHHFHSMFGVHLLDECFSQKR